MFRRKHKIFPAQTMQTLGLRQTVDADGFIHFSGRLKRFLKAGGEMISLPALEEP